MRGCEGWLRGCEGARVQGCEGASAGQSAMIAWKMALGVSAEQCER